MSQPRLWFLGGPNGAGKSTYARRIFAQDIAELRFLNADDIARDLAPLEPVLWGRIRKATKTVT